MPIKQYQGPGQPERFFSYGGGQDNYFPPYHFAQTSYGNMLRNGGFESWSQGTAQRPDAWMITSNGGTVTRSSTEYQGAYALQMVKHAGDGDIHMFQSGYQQWGMMDPGILNLPSYAPPCYDRVYQDMEGLVGDLADGDQWTLSAMVSTDTTMHCRLFVYDGTETRYSNYHTGGDSYELLWVSVRPLQGSAVLRVGIQFEPITGSDVTTLVDNVQLVRGAVPHYYQENPDDRGVICQEWDNDGTQTIIRGCTRAIPYKVTGTTSANPTVHSVALDRACRQIVHVGTNLYRFGGTFALCEVATMNYSTTGFDIKIYYYGSMGSWAYTVTGVIWALGWDDPAEQYD